MMIQYSVLMSVYHKEKAEYLKAAMDSIWNQTVPTDDFVLVCDGPLTDELNAVIDDMKNTHSVLNVVRLETNGGLGNALNVGIKKCKHDIVARMDSDDISREDRCEKQLEIFINHPEVCICSGIVEEFSLDLSIIEARRVLPETQKEILEFAKSRNPFNHPCVMYKRNSVEDAGGYQDFYLLEDYFLWIRMLQKGFIGYNLQEPLLFMRAGSDLYKRRSGLRYARSQTALFKYMMNFGFISRGQYLKSIVIRNISSLTPNWLRKYMYKSFMRK